MPKKEQSHFQSACRQALKHLSARQQDVLKRRFGLACQAVETLQGIGDSFGITRERVRQIEREAFDKLHQAKSSSELAAVFNQLAGFLKQSGGLKREDLFLAQLAEKSAGGQVRFLLCLGDSFRYFKETSQRFAFWALEKEIEERVDQLLNRIFQRLTKEDRPLSEGQLFTIAKKESPQFLSSAVEIAKNIERGPLGQFGSCSCPEIKPRGVRDAAFITLKHQGQPLHFREIASQANLLVSSCLSGREVLPQTVHNELIRDERFVLVGRGVYALRDWGYSPGTVKEVIANVLKKADEPLSKEYILENVQKQRLVKANTILLNLADKNYFQRNDQGKYFLVS